MGAYEGVILAAGHGSRMGPFGETMPKPIVPVCNKPLMAYQLESLRTVGVRKVFVVIGHLGHRIIQTMGDGSEYGVEIEYVEQQKRLGIAHALGQLERYLTRPFLVVLGDIFFDCPNLYRMFEAFQDREAAAVLAAKREADPEVVKLHAAILEDERGRVKRIIEKPRHASTNLRSCGLYLFSLNVFDAIRRTPRTALRDEYEITDSVQILVEYEQGVYTADVVDWDINVTFVDDLVTCCVHELRRRGVPHIEGRGCRIPAGTELVDTVLGDEVVIERPCRLERCVILPGTRLADGADRTGDVVGRAHEPIGGDEEELV
jgi:NDP-sugar pyrophosphorylase family protein